MKDLLGGEERVDPEASYWADAFIVNLGIAGDEDVVAPGALQTWHVDSDFFVCISEPRFTAGSFQVHFFDSPKQALLVTLIFSKVVQRGGGTYTAPDGVGLIAHYLEVTRGTLGRCFTEGIHLHFFHFYAQQSRGGPGILEAPGSGQQMLKIRRDDRRAWRCRDLTSSHAAQRLQEHPAHPTRHFQSTCLPERAVQLQPHGPGGVLVGRAQDTQGAWRRAF